MEPIQLRAVEPRRVEAADADPESYMLDALLAATRISRSPEEQPVYLPNVLASLPEAVLVVGAADSRIWSANEAALDLFGRDDLVGGLLSEAMASALLPTGDPCTPEWVPIDRALEGETVAEIELVIRRKEGDETPVLASVSPVRGVDGEVIGALLMLRSIARLRQAERLWEEFANLIVHESRGALTAILGCVGLLENLALEPIRPRKTPGYVDPETQFLGMIKADVWQINTMLSELLDISKIGARDVKLDKQPVDLVSLIADLVNQVAPNTGTLVTGHHVRVKHRRLLPVVEADPVRVEQVLTSLLTTTARYSPPGSDILVQIEPGPDEVTISVSSKVGGISKEEISRLFDQYLHRSDLRQEYKGLGLSLHVARGLVEAHGGRIWAEAQRNRGTSFYFTLPLF